MTTLVVGANADTAQALVKEMSMQGMEKGFILASRDAETLARFEADCAVRFPGNQYKPIPLDVLACEDVAAWFEALPSVPTRLIVACGILADEARAAEDSVYGQMVIAANFTALIPFIEQAALRMQPGVGQIVVFSSVAGERGRKTNMYYGCAKAGLTAYLSGLRQRLFSKDINVLTVKPGFMRTKMTHDMATPPLLTSSPEAAVRCIVKGMQRRSEVIYVKPVWRFIMGIIRCIPECIFKRLNF